MTRELPAARGRIWSWSRNIRSTGSSFLLNGSFFLQHEVTVLDDAVADALTGPAGQDWFFYKSGQDKLTDRKPDESLN